MENNVVLHHIISKVTNIKLSELHVPSEVNISTLDEEIKSFSKKELNKFFTNKEIIKTTTDKVIVCLINPSSISQFSLNYLEKIILEILNSKDVKESDSLSEEIVLQICESATNLFDFKKYNMKTLNFIKTGISLYQKVIEQLLSNECNELMLDQFMAIIAGTTDFLFEWNIDEDISFKVNGENFDSKPLKDRKKEAIRLKQLELQKEIMNQQLELKTQMKIDLQSNVESLIKMMLLLNSSCWKKTEIVWKEWSKNTMFCDSFCNIITDISAEYIQKQADASCLQSFFNVIDLSQVKDLEDFANKLKESIFKYTQTIVRACKTNEGIFIPKFPVSVLSGSFIEFGLTTLKQIPNIGLMNEILRLIACTGFETEEQMHFIERAIALLNSFLKAEIGKEQTQKENIMVLLKNPLLLEYATTMQSTMDFIPSLAESFSNFENRKIDDIPLLLSNILMFSSIKGFKESQERMAGFKEKLERETALIPLLLWHFVFGESDLTSINELIESIPTDDDKLMTSTFNILAALPYLQNTKKISEFFSLDEITKIIKKFGSSKTTINHSFLVFLNEIASLTNKSYEKVLSQTSSSKYEPEELRVLLSEARFHKNRFCNKTEDPKETERFVYNEKIYTVLDDAKDGQYNIIIRDRTGSSSFTITELLTLTGITPSLADLPEETKNERKDVRIQIEGIPKSELTFSDEESEEPGEQVALKQFGPSETQKRPAILEVMRLLNILNKPEAQIIKGSKEMDEFIKKLDNTPSVSSLYIPVYYTNKESKSLDDQWDEERVNQIISTFAKTKEEGEFQLETNTIQLKFKKHESKKCNDAPFSLIINDTKMKLKPAAIREIKSNFVVSLTPLENNYFAIYIERNEIDFPFAFKEFAIPKLITKLELIPFFITYFSFHSLSSSPEVFTANFKERSQILKQLPKGVSPLEYIFTTAP